MDNTELGKLVLKQIEAFPESFNMQTFGYITPCGTVACLGGHAMLLSGYAIRKDADGFTVFSRPDGTRIGGYGYGIEAAGLLGMQGLERAVFYLPAESAVAVFRALTEGAQLEEIPEWREFLREHEEDERWQQFLRAL